MQNKLNFLIIAFVAYCVMVGYSAEPLASPGEQAVLPGQSAQTTLQTLQAKLAQTRAGLSEIQDLLKQEDKILAGTRAQKEQTEKSKALLAEHNRAADAARQEIQKLGDQVKEAEKGLAEQSKQAERYSRVQAEFAKAQQERLDFEAKTQQAEAKLAAAQKNLTELKERLLAVTKQVNEAQARSRDLENAAKVLEIESTRRAEALTRAEKAVAMAENAEKERLLLAGRVAEVERNLPPQQQDSPELAKITTEIEKERQALAETEEKTRKEEKARAEAEKTTVELKKQLKEREQTTRSSAKEGDMGRLQARLAGIRKQRVVAEGRLKEAEGKLQEGAKSVAALTNMIAAAGKPEQDQTTASLERAKIESELEKESQSFEEAEAKLRQAKKMCAETEKSIAGLRKQLKASEAGTRSDTQKEGNVSRLQSQLESVRKQRIEAEGRLNAEQGKLQESEQSRAALINMIAAAGKQDENNKDTEKTVAILTDELEKETALMNEAAAQLDKRQREFKTVEDEKSKLNERLLLVREQLKKEGQNINKLNEITLQLAEQKKIRTEADRKLQQTIQKQNSLETEKEQLKIVLGAADARAKENESELKTTERIEAELRQEKEQAQSYADLMREKEQTLKQLDDEKSDLQNKLNEIEAKLAQQKEQIKTSEETRRALAEEKSAKLTAEKKYVALARTEKERKDEIKEMKGKLRAATKESESLSSQASKPAINSPAGTEAHQNPASGGAEETEAQDASAMTENSSQNILTVENDILNKARSSDAQPSGNDAGTVQRQEKQSIGKKTGSRSGPDRIAESDAYYALGIQKWDENDLEGAVAEFKKTIRLNPDAAGAYYNISLACLRENKRKEASDYAYKAGECYIRINNLPQATRMAVLLTKIDKNSPLIPKLRNKIAAATQ